MGIPSFYKWLIERYPRTVVDAVEAAGDGGSPIDTRLPNPNGLEFDNLYLDMNGIIHPCFHPEGPSAPKTYDEVFRAVFKYIDKIFSIVRPRKLLFLAIDGVAPRAKMNQQRSRRFRAAKDAADETEHKEMSGNVCELEEEKFTSLEHSNKLDSNVITPGTEFMSLLSSALRYYLHLKMNEDLGWRGLKVILSDASVPGEGEHKIMSYIRLQRNLPGFDPNTRHCLYGLDADLIMLALATHEIHFAILRENVQQRRNSSLPEQKNRSGRRFKKMKPVTVNLEDYISEQIFQFLNIWVLREYLALDMRTTDPKLDGDLERFIDDFVFMCLLVGNDFLPHIPSLEISEGAIDLLMMTYKREFWRMGGYLTNSFEVNLERVQTFVKTLGKFECGIFNKRMQLQKHRELLNRRSSKNKVSNYSTKLKKVQVGQVPTKLKKNEVVSNSSTKLKKVQPSVMEIQAPINSACSGLDTVVDKVKLGEEGWKKRYYAEKFGVETESYFEETRKQLVLKYIEGLCWVMHYYYEGVCSWQWFYPYHYAPLATDFHDIGVLKIQFTLGEPFKPFDQLMAVLPAASAHALPSFYRKLMTDKLSPLVDFYPTDFELDMNGKRYSWQAICKLPFIEESRLLSEISRVEHTLTDEERHRNNLGLDILFVHMSHPLAVKIVSFSKESTRPLEFLETEVKQEIDPKDSGGMNGYMVISDKPVQPAQIYSPIEGMEIILNNEVVSIFYKYPSFHAHIPRPPEGVYLPRKFIHRRDKLPPLNLWHQRLKFSERLQIPNSICGLPLAKLAHELVSKYYHMKLQKTVVCKRQIGQISADGITSCTNSQTVSGCKQSSSDATVLPDSHVGVDEPISILNLGEKVAVSDNGGDKSCSNERSNKQRNGVLDNNLGAEELSCGLKSSVDGRLGDAEGENVVADSQKRKRKRKRNKGTDLTGNHIGRDVMECLNSGEATSLVGTESNGNCINGIKILDSHVVEDGLKQTEGSGNQDDHAGVNGLACDLNLEKGICLTGAGGEKVVESQTKEKRQKDNAIPETNVGGDDLSCSSMREATSVHLTEDGPKKTEGIGIPDDHLGANGLACDSNLEGKIFWVGDGYFKVVVPLKKRRRKHKKGNGIPDNNVGGDGSACSNRREEISVVGPESSEGDELHVGRLLDHVAEDGKKQTSGSGPLDDNERRIGLSCLSMREATISAVGTESNKDCIDGYKILDSHVTEDGRKRTEVIGIPDDHVGASGLACDSNLEEKMCLAGAECEKGVVSRKKRRRKRKKGNGIPDNNVGGDGSACSNRREEISVVGPESNEGDEIHVNRVLDYHVAEDGKKQTSGSGPLDDNERRYGLSCLSMREATISVVGTESNKDVIDGYRILDSHVTEDGRKKNEGIGIPDDHVGANSLACYSNLEEKMCLAGATISVVWTESNKDCIDSYRILDNHVTEDGGKKTEGIAIPDDHVGANGLACDSILEEKMCLAGAECEKVVVSQKKKRRKHKKGNGIPDNNVGGDGSACSNMREEISVVGPGVHVNRVLDNHVAEDGKKQSGPLDDNERKSALACLSMREAILIVGTESNRDCIDGYRILDNHMTEDGRKKTEGICIPDDHVGANGLACDSNLKEKMCLAGAESDRDCIDGYRILDNHVTEGGRKKTEGIGIPDDHVGANVLACDINLEEHMCLAGAECEKVVVSQKKKKKKKRQKHKKGSGIPDNNVGGDGLACSNMREEIKVIEPDSNGGDDEIHVNRVLDNHVAEDEKKQTLESGLLDDNEGGDGLACNSNLEGRTCFVGNEGEKNVVESKKKKKRKKRSKGNGIPDDYLGGDKLACLNMNEAINVVGTQSNGNKIDGNRVLDNHVAKDEKNQTKGSGANGLACQSSNLMGSCFAQISGSKSVALESQNQEGNEGNGLGLNLIEAVTVVWTERNGNCLGNKVLDNPVAEDGKKQIKANGTPDDHGSAQRLACHLNFEEINSLGDAEGEKAAAGESQLVCDLNLEETNSLGNAEGEKATVSESQLACHLNLEERNSLGNAEVEKAVVVKSRKRKGKRKRKRDKENNVPDNHVAEDGQVCGLNSMEMVSCMNGTGIGGDDGGSEKQGKKQKTGSEC